MVNWEMELDGLRFIEGAIAGWMIGLIYFSGLWWTVRYLPKIPRRLPMILGSFILRLIVCLYGFSWVMARSPLPTTQGISVFLALLGFLGARMIVAAWINRATV